jgi:hypothetical protein
MTYLETFSLTATVVKTSVQTGKLVNVVLIDASDFGLVFFFRSQHTSMIYAMLCYDCCCCYAMLYFVRLGYVTNERRRLSSVVVVSCRGRSPVSGAPGDFRIFQKQNDFWKSRIPMGNLNGHLVESNGSYQVVYTADLLLLFYFIPQSSFRIFIWAAVYII